MTRKARDESREERERRTMRAREVNPLVQKGLRKREAHYRPAECCMRCGHYDHRTCSCMGIAVVGTYTCDRYENTRTHDEKHAEEPGI